MKQECGVTRLLWMLLAVAAVCGAEQPSGSAVMPKLNLAPDNGRPPGFPDVSGGRFAIMDRAEVEAKSGLPLAPLPKKGARFKKDPKDQVFIGDADGWMADLDAYRQRAKPEQEVLPKSRIELVSIAGTPFEKFVLLGYVPEGTTPGGPWTSVARLWAKPPGELVRLTEWDFGLDGGGVAYFDDGLNTHVKGTRATFVVTRKGAVTQTLVKWVNGTREFELIGECKLTTGCSDADEWRDLAASLPEARVSKAMDASK